MTLKTDKFAITEPIGIKIEPNNAFLDLLDHVDSENKELKITIKSTVQIELMGRITMHEISNTFEIKEPILKGMLMSFGQRNK